MINTLLYFICRMFVDVGKCAEHMNFTKQVMKQFDQHPLRIQGFHYRKQLCGSKSHNISRHSFLLTLCVHVRKALGSLIATVGDGAATDHEVILFCKNKRQYSNITVCVCRGRVGGCEPKYC